MGCLDDIQSRCPVYLSRSGSLQDAFSKDMDVIFHADYPPLLIFQTLYRRALLNERHLYVPMLQSIFFSLASLGLCFSALASFKSLGQAGLGIIFLGGVSLFLGEGGRQTADVPLAFYILASIVFLFFCYQKAAALELYIRALVWDWLPGQKMKACFFYFGAGIMVIAAIRKGSFHGLFFFFAGLFLPLVLLLYFKFQLAPPSEFLVHENGVIMQNLFTSRHRFKIIIPSRISFYIAAAGIISVFLWFCRIFYYSAFVLRQSKCGLYQPCHIRLPNYGVLFHLSNFAI